MTRVLAISTLFPSPARPGFGRFVERQFDALHRLGGIALTVINPLPQAPWPLSRIMPDHGQRDVPLCDDGRGYAVYHPRFTYLPRLSARWNPALIAHGIWPLVRRLHAEQPFELVDAQFFYPDGPAAAGIARRLGLPLTVKARGSDIHLWGGKRYALRQMQDCAGRAAGLLSVSEALKTDMTALGMPAQRIAVHYTGLDHAVFHPHDRAEARQALAALSKGAVPAGSRLLVTVGNLIPLKGQALVIRAIAGIPDVRLLLAGHGPDEASLRDLAAALGVAERVHFGTYGPSELAIALAAADAMVLPSEREGLANAWIEALACGAPLVVTDVGGAREVICSPRAGRLVERTPEAIAAAIRDLLENPPAPADVAACAARFSWDACAAQLAEFYRNAAG